MKLLFSQDKETVGPSATVPGIPPVLVNGGTLIFSLAVISCADRLKVKRWWLMGELGRTNVMYVVFAGRDDLVQ